MNASLKREELEALRSRVQQLETEIAAEETDRGSATLREYPAYYATEGFVLGVFGAMASLLFNVVGSLAAGKSPLELIRIYLTFPLGDRALRLVEGSTGVYAVGDGLVIALGCCLYLITGMALGVPVALAIAKLAPRGPFVWRFVVGGATALAIWAVNFYLILSWLQPLLLGGRWIVDTNLLPWWVAGSTHLVFGWTIAVLFPWVQSVPPAPRPD